MATFGLVHGACHGAWCWDLLVPELAARSHGSIAVDLPCDDPSADFDHYAAVASAAFERARDDLVLVGHSLGAHTVARVAQRRPVRMLVFLCGIIPVRDGERNDDEPPLEVPGTFDGLREDALGRFSFADPEDAIAAFFQDCDPELAAWAVSRLRPQSTTPHRTLGEPVALPDVPIVSIVCSEDRTATAAWGRWAARERLLGAPVHELPGSHSPFLSRPAALADLLSSLL